MKLKGKVEAVSDIIGTVLLLGFAILFFSLLSIVALSYPSTPSSPSTNLVGTIESGHLIIEHRGGQTLSLDTKIIIINSTGTRYFMVGNYLKDDNADNLWGIGECFNYPNITDDQVDISVVDYESNTVIMTVSLRGNN